MKYPDRNVLIAILIPSLLFTIVIAWPASLYFLNDDFIHLPKSAKFILGQNNSARHLGDLSLWADWKITGTNPTGYHLSNLLIHLVNTLLMGQLLIILIRHFKTGIPKAVPWLAAILFLIYPFHSEGLFWIIGRSVSLSTVFILATLICFFRSGEGVIYKIGTVLFFTLGLFSYEQIWFVPVYTLLAWVLLKKQGLPNRNYAFLSAVLVALLVLYMPFRYLLIDEILNKYEALHLFSFNPGKLGVNYAKLLLRSITPFASSVKYFFLYAALLMAILSVVAVQIISRKKADGLWTFLLVCWLISLVPFISLGISISGYESDRFLYLPSVFFCAWLVYSIHLFLKEKPAVYFNSAFMAVFIFFGYYFAQAGHDYRVAGKLGRHTIEKVCSAGVETIELDTLPITFKGIPVLRYGLDDAILWLCPDQANKKVDIKETINY